MAFQKENLKKIDFYLWEIPQAGGMRVPARLYASETMLSQILADRSLEQLTNVARLPGIREAALAMPDIHEGYGFPIGGIAAFSFSEGIISPGGIGYDINCGVRLLASQFSFSRGFRPFLEKAAGKIFQEIPAGVGQGGLIKLSPKEFDEVLEGGVSWLKKKGLSQEKKQQNIESSGVLAGAFAETVSSQAKARGCQQLGTIGAGNHFVEINYAEKIFLPKEAQSLGIFPQQIFLLIHTGSRGLGHQVATDYIRLMLKKAEKEGVSLPDRELAFAPFSSSAGQNYFAAMAAAANFAWANRQMITEKIREIWQKVFGKKEGELSLIYDVAHNIAKIEEHQIGSKKEKLLIHRKGATRAFGPFSPELPAPYFSLGQPVIIPGSMGTASYLLLGTTKAMEKTFGSVCHGAGRQMSRHQAKRVQSGKSLQTELAKKGVKVYTRNLRDLAEEGPFAYKNVDEVVEVVEKAGLAKNLMRLKPLAVIKG